MARDDYGIYRKPTAGIWAAWLGIAAAIFFGAYAVKMRQHLQEAQAGIQNAREEANQMKQQMISQMGELQALKAEIQTLKETPAAAMPVPAAADPVQPLKTSAPAPVVAVAKTEEAKRPAQAAEAAPATLVKTVAARTEKELPAVAQETPALPALAENKTELADAARLSGEILSYNPDTRKAYISLGSANGGLQPGSRFSVWRGEKYVTDIRVVKVFSVTSTCEVEGPTPIGVRSGDIAKLAAKPAGT